MVLLASTYTTYNAIVYPLYLEWVVVGDCTDNWTINNFKCRALAEFIIARHKEEAKTAPRMAFPWLPLHSLYQKAKSAVLKLIHKGSQGKALPGSIPTR